MNCSCKIYDVKEKDLFIEVSNHYFTLSDARKVYRESINTEKKDNSILIEIGEDGSEEVNEILTFGVKAAEQFALTLLNLCNSIKN